jgi:hypothetical protein
MKHGKGRKGEKRQARPSTSSAAPAAPSGSSKPAEATKGPASRCALKPWWELEPERLKYEFDELDAADISYEIDERERAGGILVLKLTVATEAGERIRLVARFSDVFPYVRFEVLAPDLKLGRHQNPLTGQLCLIGRATANWDTKNTLAFFIKDRLPKVLHAARLADSAEAEGLEEHQGEPFSDYYSYLRDSLLMVNAGWTFDFEAQGGKLIIGLEDPSEPGLRGVALAVKDEQGRTLLEADPVLSRRYRNQLESRWIKLNEPIREGEVGRYFESLYAHDQRLQELRWRNAKVRFYDIIGVVFPEEQRWRERGNGWVFAVRSTKYPQIRSRPVEHFLVRAGRAGRGDMTERVPELRPLSKCKVAVVGLGALGAPSALELARCGLSELRILDQDFVDPATTIRWPLGLSAAGRSKAAAVSEFIAANYPYTKVVAIEHRLGACRANSDTPSDMEILENLLAGVDLVYDASAEIGLNHLLSDWSAARGVPYVCVSTTHGAWGGRLIRVRPGGQTAGCWMCHQWGANNGEIPVPPADPKGEVQPAGCSDPTFTGSGFDVASIALAGVRLAVSTLAAGAAGAYPSIGWDVAIIHLRDVDGSLLASPRWDTYQLDRHPECRNDRAHKK